MAGSSKKGSGMNGCPSGIGIKLLGPVETEVDSLSGLLAMRLPTGRSTKDEGPGVDFGI